MTKGRGAARPGDCAANVRESMLAFSGTGTARFSLSGEILFLDASMLRILGLQQQFKKPGDVLGKTLADLLGSPNPFLRLLDEVKRLGHVQGAEHLIKSPSGEELWVLIDACIHPVQGKDTNELWMMARGIIEPGQARARLLESERRYRHITEAMSDYVFTVNVENGQPSSTIHGPMCVHVTGYTPEELAADPYLWIRMVPYEDQAIVRRQAEAILAGEEVFPLEHRIIRKDGMVRWVLNTSVAHFGPDGRLSSYDGVVRDITDRKQTEETLRASEQRFRLLVEHAGDALFLHDHNGVIMDVNQQACEELGYTREELLALSIADLEADQELAALREQWSKAETGQPVTLQGRYRRKDGGVFPVELRVSEFESGARRMYLSQVRDITARVHAEEHRKELEARLQQAERLESLGVLAGGIAHDFNNLLMCIMGHAELASGSVEADARIQSSLGEIQRASRRAAELCRQMLAYSGKSRLVMERINLDGIVRETCERMAATQPRHIELEYTIEKGLPPVAADGEQVRQVMRSLLANAVEAIGERPGRVRVRMGARICTRAELDDAVMGQDLHEGRYVTLEIEDNGCGMDEETLNRVFDPFFTTKFMGRGLGLAAVLGIIRGHEGTICVESQLGVGSKFTLLIPCKDIIPAA